MWTVLNEGFNLRYTVVTADLFTVVGYHIEPNSYAILEAKVSTETSLSIILHLETTNV